MAKHTRRAFLRTATAVLGSLPMARMARAGAYAPDPEDYVILPTPRPFGRAIHGGLVVREAPAVKAGQVRRLVLNEVVALVGQTEGEGPTAYNPTWYQVADGYVHSAFVQPCENNVNAPLGQVDPNGLWGEVTVPLTEARAQAETTARVRYRLYYGCIVQVIAVTASDDGAIWYQVNDGITKGLFARAEHFRPVTPDETTSLSPDVPSEAKRIDVDLAKQVVTAYEDDHPVFTARVATGYGGYGTTRGEHHVFLKTPSRRMIGGSAADYYDLPGIGWVSYFTTSRIAFHSTYWHNDYGRPRSHGCVNMLPADAKWIFRWTAPPTAYEERWTHAGKPVEGSRVKVF